MDIEKEAIIREAADKALHREVELVSKELESSLTILKERLQRLENALGSEPSMIVRLEMMTKNVEELNRRIEELRDDSALKETALHTAGRTLSIGWKVTWGVISVLVAAFLWLAKELPGYVPPTKVEQTTKSK